MHTYIFVCSTLRVILQGFVDPKRNRDLKTTLNHRVKLTAANNKQIKQLGTVNLRVKAEDREKVCKFYIVPDS